MKQLFFFFLLLSVLSCKKDEKYAPLDLKNGEVVELLVDHRYRAVNEQLLLLPQGRNAELSIDGFDERKPGYTYRVKAKFHFEKEPPMDASDRWFDFISVVKEEKYQATDSFEIALIQSPGFGGPMIVLQKTGNQYYYLNNQIQLTYTSQNVQNQLEEIWQNAVAVQQSYQSSTPIRSLKWKTVKATVTHDPANFSKAYLVSGIQFTQ
jgi:hypothetical protein